MRVNAQGVVRKQSLSRDTLQPACAGSIAAKVRGHDLAGPPLPEFSERRRSDGIWALDGIWAERHEGATLMLHRKSSQFTTAQLRRRRRIQLGVITSLIKG